MMAIKGIKCALVVLSKSLIHFKREVRRKKIGLMKWGAIALAGS